MNLADTILAHRYARAFNNLFFEQLTQQEISKLEELQDYLSTQKKDLFSIELFLKQNSAQNFFSSLIQEFKLSQFWHKFFEFIFMQKKLYLLPEIITSILHVYNNKKQQVVFFVESTRELDTSELAIIEKFLTHELKKKIILKTSLNPKLISGIKIFNNNLGWEYSIRKQLRSFTSMQEKYGKY